MKASREQFVGRGGRKLHGALEAFDLDVRGMICADFGANVGGFADCLLKRGAARVYAVDTGYGVLAWTLRNDERVVVMERTNALYCSPPGPVDLVVCDVAWTPQKLIVPAAIAWAGPAGQVVSLMKPHYEATKLRGRKPAGRLDDAEAKSLCLEVCERLAGAGCTVRAVAPSDLRGKGGNREFFLWFRGFRKPTLGWAFAKSVSSQSRNVRFPR